LRPGGPLISESAAGGSGAPTVSLNWSGYAVTSKKLFTYVHTTFVQPAITCTGQPDQWTSNWSGLDGYTSDTVEQDGTIAICPGSGSTTPEYGTWWEMYPSNDVQIVGGTVKPGDKITASVVRSGTKYTLTLADHTQNWSRTFNSSLSGAQDATAEVIVRSAGFLLDQVDKAVPHAS